MYIRATAPGLGAIAAARPMPFLVPRSPRGLRRVYVRRGVGDILQPTTGVVNSSMINWTGTVPVPDASQYLSQMVSSLEGDVRYKLESGGTILDPAACQAKLAGELASQCSIYPDVCKGVDVGSLTANLCGHYGDYLAQQQASLGNPQTNYVAPVHEYPIYTEGQAVQYYTPQQSQPLQPTTQTGPQGSIVQTINPYPSAQPSTPAPKSTPAPVVSSSSSAAPSSVGTQSQQQQQTQMYPSSSSAIAPAAVGGLDSLPSWALPVGIAAAVALFMFGGSR